MTQLAVIRDNLMDVLGFQHSVLRRIERHAGEERVKRFDRAFGMLQKIREVLILHAGELELHLSSVDGGFERKLKQTAASFLGAFVYLYEKFRTSEPVSRNLRDDYTLLNHAVITYGMLHTAMLAVKENEIADMARRHMTDLTPLIVDLSEVIPFVLVSELADQLDIEGGQSVARQAVVQYREAWTRRAAPGEPPGPG